MPKRTDIKSILIIGAGPIVIGQACEFDYSGTQACRVLRKEGYRVILVNSNPATIMTDPDLADATYIEPITPDFVEKIIEKERPDALLPTMGGQTALNTALALAKRGVLEKYGVEMIGAKEAAIEKAEDRSKFRVAMEEAGLATAKSEVAHCEEDAIAALDKVGLPAIIRPSFTLGGTGGGVAYNKEEYYKFVRTGLEASPTTEILIEESLLGWKEYEMEVVRDRADNAVIVCSIENIDPMGVHTGDSVTVAPALTLTDKEYQKMRDASLKVLRVIGVETGGSNVQFAVNPNDGRMIVIEMNPRVSRSSALASKATGFPIAKIAALLAVGYTLDELVNDATGCTPASFEPSIDYVVTKIPRFSFEKFPDADPFLTTSMKSVGEVMAIGRSFSESFQKALRSMETGMTGLNTPLSVKRLGEGDDLNVLRAALAKTGADRLSVAAEALRMNVSVREIYDITGFDPWFLERFRVLLEIEDEIAQNGLPQNKDGWVYVKSYGFGDARLAELAGVSADEVMRLRHACGARPVFKRVDTCAAEFDTQTSYLYSTYETAAEGAEPECESRPTDRKKILIIGSGPNRIGQGIEFDYSCCHAAFALKERNIETIMVNCNPETVSTDYDTADRLYFEPLTLENILEIVHKEQQNGEFLGVIVQLGGQTPLKLSAQLQKYGVPILGTSPENIDLAEDRERFKEVLNRLNLKQPENGIARTEAEAMAVAKRIGFPAVVRPSYVLGGRAMEIVRNVEQLERYIKEAVTVSGESPVLIDKYLPNAIETDVDAICDGEEVYICGVMEHIEEAGIHSGDSGCSMPPNSLSDNIVRELKKQTEALALALNVKGLINIQFAIINAHLPGEEEIYLLEANPRASRTAPFTAKVTGVPIVKYAARVAAGEKLKNIRPPEITPDYVAVKEAVFPFSRFPGVDTLLGPEMRSTGEVMGIDRTFTAAFLKSQIAAGSAPPASGNVFLSVRDADKAGVVASALALDKAGYGVYATKGTAEYLEKNGVRVKKVNKVLEGRPHIADMIRDGEIHMVINTVEGAQSVTDSFEIRQSALYMKIPYYTTLAGAKAAVGAAVLLHSKAELTVNKIQNYYRTEANRGTV